MVLRRSLGVRVLFVLLVLLVASCGDGRDESADTEAASTTATTTTTTVAPMTTEAQAGSDGPLSLVWGYCGGGSPDIVVAKLGEPFEWLSHLSGYLLGGGIISWAPDGSAFATVHSGGIAVVDVATGSVSPITDGADLDPSWSSDGSAIAFSRVADESGAPDLWLVHPDGSGLDQLTDTPQTWEISPSWSPDNTQIAFVASDSPEDSGFDVWVMARDTADATNVTNAPLYAYGDLAWSPNGSELALTAFTSAYPDIVIVSLDGGSTRNVTEDLSESASDPAWSPDGRRIAYSRGTRNAESDIWVMDSDGGNAVQWTDLDDCEWNPTWEPWPGAYPVTSDWVAFRSDEPPSSVSHP